MSEGFVVLYLLSRAVLRRIDKAPLSYKERLFLYKSFALTAAWQRFLSLRGCFNRSGIFTIEQFSITKYYKGLFLLFNSLINQGYILVVRNQRDTGETYFPIIFLLNNIINISKRNIRAEP